MSFLHNFGAVADCDRVSLYRRNDLIRLLNYSERRHVYVDDFMALIRQNRLDDADDAHLRHMAVDPHRARRAPTSWASCDQIWSPTTPREEARRPTRLTRCNFQFSWAFLQGPQAFPRELVRELWRPRVERQQQWDFPLRSESDCEPAEPAEERGVSASCR